MKLEKIIYEALTPRQQEIFNFQKIAGLLADYGFNCIKLADDWQGADFLAYHKDRTDTLKVELKPRLTIDRKYIGQGLWMAFPLDLRWYLIEHDTLVRLAGALTPWLTTSSWRVKGCYHTGAPNQRFRSALREHCL